MGTVGMSQPAKDIREHHHGSPVDDLTGDTPEGDVVEPVTGQQETPLASFTKPLKSAILGSDA